MSKIRVPLCSAVLTLVVLPACGALNFVSNLGRTPGPNPTTGQPLTFKEEAKNVPFEGSKMCTTWPLESKGKVVVSDDKICIEAQRTTIETMHQDRSPEQVSFASDSRGDGNMHFSGPAKTDEPGGLEGSTQKIGSCAPTTGQQGGEIWVTTWKGCIPNKETGGNPLVTAQSTYLDAQPVHSWKFTPAAPAVAPAAAPAPANAPAPAQAASR